MKKLTNLTVIRVTPEEREDIRFALGHLAQSNETAADACTNDADKTLFRTLMEQCERLRALARKISA